LDLPALPPATASRTRVVQAVGAVHHRDRTRPFPPNPFVCQAEPVSREPMNMKLSTIVMLALSATGCSSSDKDGGNATGDGGGGSGGSSSFTPGNVPSEVCALITLADVQTILPTATAGVEEPTADNSAVGFQSRICKYDAGNQSVELEVFIALTQAGLDGIELAAQSGDVNVPVDGVGDEAHFWENNDVNTGGLWALQSPYSVDITNYFPPAFPTADQMKPLVVKALAGLQK
jgi:hypothetical protein